MKKIDLESTLCIYDEGEITAIYEVKKTKSDIVKALADSGYFDDIDEDDWELGIGYENCHSLADVASVIIDNNSFYDEEADMFFGLGGSCPCK